MEVFNTNDITAKVFNILKAKDMLDNSVDSQIEKLERYWHEENSKLVESFKNIRLFFTKNPDLFYVINPNGKYDFTKVKATQFSHYRSFGGIVYISFGNVVLRFEDGILVSVSLDLDYTYHKKLDIHDNEFCVSHFNCNTAKTIDDWHNGLIYIKNRKKYLDHLVKEINNALDDISNKQLNRLNNLVGDCGEASRPKVTEEVTISFKVVR